MFAKVIGPGRAYNLKQCVFNNAYGKPGADIGNGSPVFLRLLYVAVHKYGAAAAKVNRFIGKKAYFGKIFRAVTENAGKSLQKAAASAGACFV